MKFVHLLLLGAVAAEDKECNTKKDAKTNACPEKTCCAVYVDDDMEKQDWFAKLDDAKKKQLEADGQKELDAGNSLCWAADKTTNLVKLDEETGQAGATATITYKCQGADDGKKKEGDKKEGDKKEGDKKEGDKKEGDKKEGDKKDGDAKEGERGTLKEGEECNHKEAGKGCVEKMCCGKVSAVNLDGLPKEMADQKDALKKKMDEGLEKAKEKGEGLCMPDDKTEWEMPKVKAKMTYECGASALAATAIVALSAMVNM